MKKIILNDIMLIAIAIALVPAAAYAVSYVNQVRSTGSTLTVSPSTGIVNAEINLAHENEWEAPQAFHGIKWGDTGNYFMFEDGTVNSRNLVQVLDADGNITGASLLVDRLMLRSPNGTCFEQKVSDAGALSASTTTCP